MRTTYHLVPEADWSSRDAAAPYRPASLADEGFIHCTDGLDNLVDTANRYYANDDRPYLALTIDLDRVGSPWRIDVPGTPYPHVHGPIDPAAIVDVAPMPRLPDGRFFALTLSPTRHRGRTSAGGRGP